MENSTHSSVDASSCSYEEESGWTTYFEDFMESEQRRRAAGDSSSRVAAGNSMISDAASCAPRIKTAKGQPPTAGLEVSEKYRKLSLKRRKGRRLLEDDALEDTASSPVNSPKITPLSAIPSKKDQNQDTALEDGFVERASECSELKKRGLCLVPLSMIDFIV
ncbi:vascular-related unknown protein 1-like isoform X1 [Zingiber officinale]|uniref:Uncharacterized protein n=1 Tax=Zingiber officinale TaxID=94328 RepID=A0A8J5HZP7_ZINOF|nr:vascular-related unknown protein 1-like isoform X1 [Zingiber officinale]KAG6535086.1 hypothetical protein ZIOFF_000040 [Zingiber officinale]